MSKVLEQLTDENYNKIPRVVNNFCNGKCSRCGECCGAAPMPLTRKEEKVIRKYVEEHKIPYQSSELHASKTVYGKLDENLRCCFYDAANKKCLIYPVRPEICKSFRCNMTPENIETNKLRCHKRAYWNHIVDEADNTIHLTNFAILFYNRYADLFKWILTNLKTASYIELKDVNKGLVNKALNIMELGGIDVQKILPQLEQEMKEDEHRFRQFSDSNDTNNNS